MTYLTRKGNHGVGGTPNSQSVPIGAEGASEAACQQCLPRARFTARKRCVAQSDQSFSSQQRTIAVARRLSRRDRPMAPKTQESEKSACQVREVWAAQRVGRIQNMGLWCAPSVGGRLSGGQQQSTSGLLCLWARMIFDRADEQTAQRWRGS